MVTEAKPRRLKRFEGALDLGLHVGIKGVAHVRTGSPPLKERFPEGARIAHEQRNATDLRQAMFLTEAPVRLGGGKPADQIEPRPDQMPFGRP
jgi:hypothetical protein